jgi:hypothetical protein
MATAKAQGAADHYACKTAVSNSCQNCMADGRRDGDVRHKMAKCESLGNKCVAYCGKCNTGECHWATNCPKKRAGK